MFFLKILQYSQESTCVEGLRSETLLKINSNTGVFLRILRNFQENLFWRTFANGCFWKVFLKINVSTGIGFLEWKIQKLSEPNAARLHVYLKVALVTGAFLWVLEIFQNTSFVKHLRTTASIISCILFLNTAEKRFWFCKCV